MLKGVVASAVLLLVVVLVVRTVHLSRRPPQTSECKPTDSDFIPLNDERLQRFQKAISFESVSRDDGDSNSDEMFRYGEFIIASFPHIHRHSPLVTWERVNNLSLLYHVQGSDPSLRPYLLMAHTDVVPVTNLDQWNAPPFSGEVKDGFIYGRGTIDDKNNVMGILEATEFMLASKIRPQRSFYVALGHDEEIRGYQGAGLVAKRLAEKGVKEFEFIVDEGMAVFEGIIDGVSSPVASVGVSEKGMIVVKLSVEMPPGHSSMPPKETPITVLANAVKRLADNPQPSMLGYGVETDMFESLVPEVLDYDRAVIGDPRVKMEVIQAMEPHPVAGYRDTDFGYQVTIMVGNTDTIHYLNFTGDVYRFSPTHMFPGDPERFHGINERMSVKNYEQVINFFYHLIRNADQAGLSPAHSTHSDL
ncbi:N-fatty-acyl-amino acid synthase/hydrolase PM20D1.1 [Elysia marginata]|uniref:N-fatty-acyl-amino acid synthase/hydrolase PM20D1.1 n=1 Tax=Elysia marginata TaxID=1093978 RepID=A0AAV4JJJ7_9GAST|nr:N-fatty-acyl-amino acid synthase/hydrolase PM20D1.1 [Elysia marginata]